MHPKTDAIFIHGEVISCIKHISPFYEEPKKNVEEPNILVILPTNLTWDKEN